MDGMDIGDLTGPKDLPRAIGQKMIEIADGVLAENLGRTPETEERASLAETMVSELLSSMYCILRDQEGSEKAEKWLRKTLTLSAAAVRVKGSDALVKIDLSIRDVPNAIGPAPASTPETKKTEEPSSPKPLCSCPKDAQDRCIGPCGRQMAAIFRQFFSALRGMMRFKGALEGICAICQREELDRAIASSVPEIFRSGDQLVTDEGGDIVEFAHEILGLCGQLAFGMGVKELPLTIEAWKKEAKARGLEVSEIS
jgi:hypothetical protein